MGFLSLLSSFLLLVHTPLYELESITALPLLLCYFFPKFLVGWPLMDVSILKEKRRRPTNGVRWVSSPCWRYAYISLTIIRPYRKIVPSIPVQRYLAIFCTQVQHLCCDFCSYRYKFGQNCTVQHFLRPFSAYTIDCVLLQSSPPKTAAPR